MSTYTEQNRRVRVGELHDEKLQGIHLHQPLCLEARRLGIAQARTAPVITNTWPETHST